MSKFRGYKKRNQRIRSAVGMSYKEYLASNIWKEKRARVLDRDHHQCVLCGNPATNVHHSNYGDEALFGWYIDSLWSVCRGCHYFIEFTGKHKNNLTEMRRRMVYLALRNHSEKTISRMCELGWKHLPLRD